MTHPRTFIFPVREASCNFVTWKERGGSGTVIRQSTEHITRLHFQSHSTFQHECSNAWKRFSTLNLENTEMGVMSKSDGITAVVLNTYSS